MEDSTQATFYTVHALLRLAQRWSDGDLPGITPDTGEANICIDYLQKRLSQYQLSSDIADPDRTKKIDAAYDDVQRSYVINHYVTTASHRRWVRLMYRLMSMARLLECDDELDRATMLHDLSKYGPEEALGYGVMFGKTGAFRALEGSEKDKWDAALQSHLHSNAHHPQYFCGDGSADMGEAALEESVIDMLACRVERQLADKKRVCPAHLTDIDPKFLQRYTEKDQKAVAKLLVKWRQGLETFIDGACAGDSIVSIRQWEADSERELLNMSQKI